MHAEEDKKTAVSFEQYGPEMQSTPERLVLSPMLRFVRRLRARTRLGKPWPGPSEYKRVVPKFDWQD